MTSAYIAPVSVIWPLACNRPVSRSSSARRHTGTISVAGPGPVRTAMAFW